MRKSYVLALLLVPLLMGLGAPGSAISATTTCGDSLALPLVSGRFAASVGTITTANDGDNLYITYSTNTPWRLKSVQLDIQDTAERFPQTKTGNPVPGRFANRATTTATTHTFTVPLGGRAPGATVLLAAHADIVRPDPTLGTVADGAWGAGTQFAGANWAQYFAFNVKPCIVRYSPGPEAPVANLTVDALGGRIALDQTGTPLDGVVVTIPGGALPRPVEVTVGYNSGRMRVNTGTFSGVVLSLTVPDVKEFGQPVTITVPIPPGVTGTPVPYYVRPDGLLRPAQLVSVDWTNRRFTFWTFHASWFTWIWAAQTPSADETVTTDYKPLANGFQVTNNGSTYNRDGECFGMTAFSLWYFMDQSARGHLYDNYYGVVSWNWWLWDLRGQDIIATRAFISISQQWTSYYSQIARSQGLLSPSGRYDSIHNIIANTGNPVLIYLFHADDAEGAHSVLAYEVDLSTGDISIYDPNYPGETKTIRYDTQSQMFSSYAGYDGIVYNGDGSLVLTEEYENIVADAEADFHHSGDALVSVTSHPSGSTVSTNTITLSGTIESGEVLVTRLIVSVGSVDFTTNVAEDGSFGIPINLQSGLNHLQFSTKGTDFRGNEIDVPNDQWSTDYVIESTAPRTVVLMTLTWDTNDTDLDTYVIDPTGDYSAYYHPTTADGGVLDRDVTWGYGPEHWTLTTANTVRYGSPYRFRVHYYSDHGHGPSNYTVTIALYEGTSHAVTHSYRGNLAVSNPSNSLPNGTGADWADIASITLVRPTTLTAATMSAAPAEAADTPGGIQLTVPVPPAAERIKP